ncbi:DUF3068 domain-containing protein [Nocardia terpenica]|uniref:DUF3068 domain-containing protein n=1 Tax=Nocardia terpenica TaxID=455432 RepID=UPI0018930779|nr:DUF3068 domain-containing protein [Nocardia terpenica]MBF6061988.1 DUF3068 domain-containing protein [Nocardia terpenica]MBF6106212.1 DUF3068 domain-containing protein [Nocardia terpenica]MBF6110408.1 DUF3068 domain-containing protein [Nocardia terpenica]MBF6120755.1 DUF3068 domain-containing protein [Nocardia terpenica]MBF6151744.1 DUF3068 domain-containing protein [Nocardia terpenica]
MTGRKTSAAPGSRASRIVACVLIGLGAAVATAAVLLPTYVVPHLRKIPLDISANTVSNAPGSQLVDAAATAAGRARTETGVPLKFRVYVRTEDPSDSHVVTIQAATSMTRTDKPNNQPFISATVDRVTLDRTTAMPVADRPSEVAVVTTRPPDPTPGRNGLQYKFPFDVQKHSYPFWDITSRTTHPIDYADDARVVDGMRLYHFHQKVAPIDLRPGQPEARLTLSAAAWGLPDRDPAEQITFDLYFEVERDVWVEPLSGSIVEVREHLHRFLARSATGDPHALTTLDARTAFDQATIDHLAGLAHDARTKLLWGGRYAPILLGVAGLVLLSTGLLLGIRANALSGRLL